MFYFHFFHFLFFIYGTSGGSLCAEGLSGSIGGVRSIGARFGNQDSVSGEEDGKVKRRRTRVGRGIAGENKKGARWIRHENKEKKRRRRRRKKRLCVPHIKHTTEDKANVKRKRNRHNLPKGPAHSVSQCNKNVCNRHQLVCRVKRCPH